MLVPVLDSFACELHDDELGFVTGVRGLTDVHDLTEKKERIPHETFICTAISLIALVPFCLTRAVGAPKKVLNTKSPSQPHSSVSVIPLRFFSYFSSRAIIVAIAVAKVKASPSPSPSRGREKHVSHSAAFQPSPPPPPSSPSPSPSPPPPPSAAPPPLTRILGVVAPMEQKKRALPLRQRPRRRKAAALLSCLQSSLQGGRRRRPRTTTRRRRRRRRRCWRSFSCPLFKTRDNFYFPVCHQYLVQEDCFYE